MACSEHTYCKHKNATPGRLEDFYNQNLKSCLLLPRCCTSVFISYFYCLNVNCASLSSKEWLSWYWTDIAVVLYPESQVLHPLWLQIFPYSTVVEPKNSPAFLVPLSLAISIIWLLFLHTALHYPVKPLTKKLSLSTQHLSLWVWMSAW